MQKKSITVIVIILIVIVLTSLFSYLAYNYFKKPAVQTEGNETQEVESLVSDKNESTDVDIKEDADKENITGEHPAGGDDKRGGDGDCTPNCAGKECGDNGCEGSCGACNSTQTCNATGKCTYLGTCIPECSGKQCGSDGCSSTCPPGCSVTEYCENGICRQTAYFEATYYIDNSIASDCSNYNVSTRTCGNGNKQAYNTIQEGVNILQPGNVLAVRGGTYREGIILNANGTASQRITIIEYPGESAIIKGSDVLSGWVKCSSQADCLGNPNWNNIYYAQTRSYLYPGVLLENEKILRPSQKPDQTDPEIENSGEFEPLIDEGNNFGHPIVGLVAGASGVGSFKIADSGGFYASLYNTGEKIIIKVKSGSNANNGTYTLIGNPVNSAGVTEFKVNREVYSDVFNNLELENQKYFVDSDLNQPDDYWNGAKIRFWSHAANNFVLHYTVKDFIASKHLVVFDRQLDNYVAQTSDGFSYNDAYMLFNHPLILDSAGEYYFTTEPVGGYYTVYLWPKDVADLNGKIEASYYTCGIKIESELGNYVTISGFNLSGFSTGIHPATSTPEGTTGTGGICGQKNKGVIIENNDIINLKGYGGILLLSGESNIVRNNSVKNNLYNFGIFVTGTKIKVLDNYLDKTQSTSIQLTGCDKVIAKGNVVGAASTHGNGITTYAITKNILVVGNLLKGNFYTMQNCYNITFYNNIFATGLRDWGGNYCQNVTIYNNLFLDPSTTNLAMGGVGSAISRNNIIDGGYSNVRSNNIYISRVWSQEPRYGWTLGPNEIVADGTTVYGPAYTVADIFEVNDWPYYLKENSLAIDKGINITSELPSWLDDSFFDEIDFTKDLEGNSRGQGAGWDIGPYEYQAGIGGTSIQSETELRSEGIIGTISNWFRSLINGNTIKEITGYFLKS